MLITILILKIVQVFSICPYNDGEIDLLSLSGQYKQMDVDMSNFFDNTQLGYVIWFKYQPFIDITLIELKGETTTNKQTFSGSTSASSFVIDSIQYKLIHLEQYKDKGTNILHHYVTLDQKNNIIKHVVNIQAQSQVHNLEFDFDSLEYEGKWVLFSILYDNINSKIRVLFHLSGSITPQTMEINDKPQYSSTIRYILGGAVSYINSGITYSLNQFNGRISDLVQTQQIDILTDFTSFISECSIQDECSNEQIDLSNQFQFNPGTTYTSFVSQPKDINKYIIYGWFKLNSLSEETSKISVAIRISLNQDYTNNDNIGDRLLYFEYSQNQVSASNGFQASTYSYTFPLSEQYKTQTDDIVSYYSPQMQIALTNWHYIQYEMGRSDQIGPKLTLIFPQLSTPTFIYTWSKEIYHFTGSKMYIQIGGDKYSTSSYFSGYIANLKFQNCLPNDSPILLSCHYSCLSCIGPTINNCLTCSNSRIYSISQKTCTCKSGFIDMEDTLECIALNVLYPSITEIEQEISIIECSHSYFQFGDQCIHCPQQNIKNDKIIVFCVDCIVDPQGWQYSLSCTYDYISYSYNQANNYMKNIRDPINYDFYQIVDAFPQLLSGYLNENSCKQGYYNLNSLCYKCSQGCLQCTQDNNCQECQSGYALVENIYCQPCLNCPTCYYQSGQILCNSCLQKQVLVNGVCQNCGYKCQSCTSTKCLYCEDPSLYYLSFDGYNCQPCVLDNCLYCYQYAFYGSDFLFTFEYEILQISMAYFQLQTACAYCINDKYIDMLTGLCVDKIIQIDPIIDPVIPGDSGDPVAPSGTSGSSGSSSSQISLTTCNLGLYTTSSNEKCLISDSDQSAVEQTKCDILNCAYCIKNYEGSISYCMICNQGYYANNLTGQCIICPTTCFTCQMQNKFTKDAWKWNIRAYYQFVFNNDGSHSYLQNGQSDQESDYEIICTSCQLGKLLYNDTCINDCDSKCEECEILDGVAVCTQCTEAIDGPIRTNIDGICTECQPTCSACQQRQTEEYNPYYSSSQLKFSKYCYESDSYLDQNGLVAVCDTYSKCKKSIVIKINIYCNIEDFTSQLNQAIDQEQFKLQNVMIQDILTAGATIESNGLYLYLNQKSIRKADIEFTIIQGTAEFCSVPNLSKFSTKFRQNVYSLQYLSFSLIGLHTNTQIRLEGSFNLTNFTTLSFINLTIDSYFTSLKPSLLYILNYYLTDTVNLINVTFTTTSMWMFIKPIYIVIESIKNINMENVVLTAFRISSQSQLFTISNSNPVTLNIINFTIQDSLITNSSIFKFSSVSQSISNVLSFNNIKITNTIMNNSTFLLTTHNSKDSVGSLNVVNLYLSRLSLITSTFWSIPSLQSATFQNINFLNSTLLTQSYFINTNIIQMSDLIIDAIIIDSGTIIKNTDLYTQDPLALNSIQLSTIQNITFSNIIYYKAKALLQLNQQNLNQFSVIIKQMSIINVQIYEISRGNTLSNYISFEDSIIYIESLRCLLEDVIIQRAHGYPELTLIVSKQLTINRMNVQLIEDFFSRVLHTSLDCMTNLTYTDQHEIIYIGDYQYVNITELTIIGLISFNYPLVILQSKNLMQYSQSEEITIQNSQFEQNMLVITATNMETAIIQIISDQSLTLNLLNIKFTKNHLNQYIQDLMKQSSATLLIQTQKAVINLDKITFSQNIVTNSTNSILYIKCETLTLINSLFYSNNIVTTELLNNNILWGDQETDNSDIMYYQFSVISDSGNGVIIAQLINIQQVVIYQSYANNGAGFSISPFGQGYISIKDSIIQGTMASLEYTALSQGGFLYIDGSKAKIQLYIMNTTISESYSRYQGGAIYIVPSSSSNYIYLANLIVKDVYSMQNSFISVLCTKLSTLSAQIIMENITFTNSRKGFETYLGFNSLSDLTSDEINQIHENNPFIYTKYSNMTMIGCNFINMHNQLLIQIIQGQQVFLQRIKVKNSTIYYSPLIQITPRSSSTSQIFIDDLEISQVQQFSEISTSAGDCVTFIASINDIMTMICPLNFNNTFSDSQSIIFESYNSRQSYCNQYKIYQNKSVNISLIHISEIESNHKIILKNLDLNDITCIGCYFGLIHFISITATTYLQEILKIQQLKLQNNICGTMGCLNIMQSDLDTSDLPISSDFSMNRRLLTNLNYNYLSSLLIYNVLITDCQFTNNSAKYGPGIMIIRMSILIIRSAINQNYADYYGGGIYFYGSDQNFYIFDSQISENKALLGSGIYLKDYQIQRYDLLDVSINNNNSTSLQSDLFESPRSLTISIDGGSTFLPKKLILNTSYTLQEEVYVAPFKILGTSTYANRIMFPSGQQISSYTYFDPYTQTDIPYNLTFRVIPLNRQNTQEKQISSSSVCSLNAYLINHTSETTIESQDTYLSYNSVKFNTTSGDFNLDDLIIYFSPYQDADLVLRIIFKCDIIKIPIYSEIPPYLIQSYVAEYSLQIDIQTFPCQLGEYYNGTLNACIQCNSNENQYSVFYGALSCSFKNDLTMENIKSSMILIRQNYWRPYIESKQIEHCYHLTQSCLGGWIPGDTSCSIGHIGALCEQCDLYNTRGSGSYSVSTEYSCGSCDLVTGNSLSIAFISMWTLISILMSVSSNIETIDEFILALRIKAFGINVVLSHSSSGILIKVFTNYLQIISTISTFQLSVPSELASVVNSVGNPIETMSYSLDCFLISISDILIIYFRIIWSLLLATLYIIFFLCLYSLAILTKQKKYNVSFITTTLIYMYIYLQPNLVGGLISLISYRIISEEYWIQGNVGYRYDTQQHYQWLIAFVLPLLIILGALMPFILWFGIYQNRYILDRTYVRKLWGYLYNEYKSKAYFWETIKILQKEFMIIVLTYYEDHIPVKAALVFLVLFLYSFMTNKHKPYLTGELNTIDQRSTIVCAVSIIFASTIYSSQTAGLIEIIWPFYIMIGIMNGYFIIQMVLKICFAYFNKLNDHIDKVKLKIIQIYPKMKENKIIYKYLETHKCKQDRIKRRFEQLRIYLVNQAKQILVYKRSQKFELPGRLFTNPNENDEKNSTPSGRSLIHSPNMDDQTSEKQKIVKILSENPKVYPESQEMLFTLNLHHDKIPSPVKYVKE